MPALGYASFILVGWNALLVPSLVPAIERDFAQPDAGVGVLYFATAVLFVTGSLVGGFAMEHLGRSRALPAAVFGMAAGLALEAVAPSWAVFVAGGALAGFGSGAVEVGLNGLFLDRFSEDRGRALSRLHLCFSLGALAAPLVIAALVEIGVAWRLPFAASSGVVLVIGLGLAASDLRVPHPVVASRAGRPSVGRHVPLPLVLLAVAITSYVAAESGVSSWLVRFLDAAPIGIATLALSLFWAGLALGRLVASRVADRFAPLSVATACGLATGVAVLAAVVVPWVGGLHRAVRRRGRRLRPDLPDDHRVRGRALPGAGERRERRPDGLRRSPGPSSTHRRWGSSRTAWASASGWPARACSPWPAPARWWGPGCSPARTFERTRRSWPDLGIRQEPAARPCNPPPDRLTPRVVGRSVNNT